VAVETIKALAGSIIAGLPGLAAIEAIKKISVKDAEVAASYSFTIGMRIVKIITKITSKPSAKAVIKSTIAVSITSQRLFL
jgi:hypothetical protein